MANATAASNALRRGLNLLATSNAALRRPGVALLDGKAWVFHTSTKVQMPQRHALPFVDRLARTSGPLQAIRAWCKSYVTLMEQIPPPAPS